jgi:hypothetical protein
MRWVLLLLILTIGALICIFGVDWHGDETKPYFVRLSKQPVTADCRVVFMGHRIGHVHKVRNADADMNIEIRVRDSFPMTDNLRVAPDAAPPNEIRSITLVSVPVKAPPVREMAAGAELPRATNFE